MLCELTELIQSEEPDVAELIQDIVQRMQADDRIDGWLGD